MRSIFIMPIFVLYFAVFIMVQPTLAITMRCYFDCGQVETAIENDDLKNLEKILLERFNIPSDKSITFAIINQAVHVDAKNYSYQKCVAQYLYPKISADKKLKISQGQ